MSQKLKKMLWIRKQMTTFRVYATRTPKSLDLSHFITAGNRTWTCTSGTPEPKFCDSRPHRIFTCTIVWFSSILCFTVWYSPLPLLSALLSNFCLYSWWIFPFILWKMEPPARIIIPQLPHIDNLLRHLPLRPFQPFHSILKHGFRHLLNASDMIPGKHCV